MSTETQVAGGHMVNINTPNTMKQKFVALLDNALEGSKPGKEQDEQPNDAIGGLKASLKHPNVSDEAKQSAKERLSEMHSLRAVSQHPPNDLFVLMACNT
ncbi:hypothetical protein B0H66DRAFT_600038 [Apodospora peruviana]|uniref:Conidiation protein 6 n=1 Tax=Apodospora peruviana TaxID=516989 RepID=A0AAE0IIL3_9PEZI|nr:hypothetical protein B0H66DRAFT_600038 [Apodospora peruviana]